jgi:CMP-N,N'-diacetyllegionaminic acid synthase
MIEDKSVLAVIPARGGSKGVPGKNVLDIGGKPLIAWTIEAALQSKYIDRLILTSEDAEIISIAKEWQCETPVTRPPELATDEARVQDAIVHLLENLGKDYDYLVLLQATSPLRTTDDIDECLELCLKSDARSAMSVVESAKSPYWMYRIETDNRLAPILPQQKDGYRRQNLPTVYAANGAIYVTDTKYFLDIEEFVTAETIAYVMPAERSLDIDAPMDLTCARALIYELQSK